MELIDLLIRAREVISDPDRWTAHDFARNGVGHRVRPQDPTAVCFCSLGALAKVSKPVDASPGYTLVDEAEFHLSQFMEGDVPLFNDTRTHQEVLAAWDEAISDLKGNTNERYA